MAPNDGGTLKDDNGNVMKSDEEESSSTTTTRHGHSPADSRLDDLADEAAKKVDEFTALLADVESRSRNQRVLLERHYENMEAASSAAEQGFLTKRPTTLSVLTNGQRITPSAEFPVSKLKVDELMDFGPLSKKLKKNAELSPPLLSTIAIPSGRRFSTFAASLPRSQYGRKNSVPPGLLMATLPHMGDSSAGSSKVNGDSITTTTHNTVGGLVKLFSETTSPLPTSVGQGNSLEKPDGSKKRGPIPPPLRPPPGNSPPASARLLVRGPEKVVFCSEPRSPMANGPLLSPRVTSPQPLQNAGHLSVSQASGGGAGGKRSPSPSFSNSFFFGKNSQGGSEQGRVDRPMSPLTTGSATVKRSQSPSSFPNPFAFARKFSGAFVVENGGEKKQKADRPLSPPTSVAAEISVNQARSGAVASPYAALKKTNEAEKEKRTIIQRRGSANPQGSHKTTQKLSNTNGNSAGPPTTTEPAVVYRSMSHLSIPDSTNPERPTSPGFFGFNKSPKKDKSDTTSTDRNRADISSLERLLAGLNFSKFRITADRLVGMGSTSPATATSQQAAEACVPGAVERQVGQQHSSPTTEASQAQQQQQPSKESLPARSFMTRTVSQPAGLSIGLESGSAGGGAGNVPVQLRRDRARVTVSEDRLANTQPAALLQAGASSEKVSDDIASLITDIRQHFQLSRKRELLPPHSTHGASLVKVKNEGGTDTSCVDSNRDSDYVVSMVSDCDYSESTGGHDENFEVDTESTSSSFIFSPTATSAASRAATVERDPLISGTIQPQTPAAARPAVTAGYQPGAEKGSVPQKKPSESSSLYTSAVCTVNPYSRVSSSEQQQRSMTFPPGQGRKNSTTIPDTGTDSQYMHGPTTSTNATSNHHQHHHTWDVDDPEHRLSSASFPESAISLTDSVYSTAGSTSLSSYIDTSLSDASSLVRPTLLSESNGGGGNTNDGTKDVRVGKPRYHSDPMTVAVASSQLPGGGGAGGSTTPHSSISEPILQSSTKSPPATGGGLSLSSSTKQKSAGVGAPEIPPGVKDVVLRESGGEFFVSLEESKSGTMAKVQPLVLQKDYRSDSFRRSEKRLPRGPFGARLEEDQLRREQRQLVQDLSFLHDSPASTPGLPEISPSLPEIEADKMQKRRQSAALPGQQAEKLSRQYVAVRSSPDLFRTAGGHPGMSSSSPLSPPSGLRLGMDICRSVSDAQASSWKKITEETDSAIYSGSSDSVPNESSVSSGSQLSTKGVTDFRTHIVRELYDTENSYVESLQILEKYYSTLKKNEDLVEKTLSENMFYQIPSIKQHHESLLTHLKHRIENWDTRQKIGDLIVDTFTKEAVIDTYTAFINNWKTAKDAIKLAKTTRPCFVRCLEEWTREHRGKLNLDALLIMPVQRIPRYELLIKELLKHTPEDHPDRVDLETAQSELHDLALKINAMEHEVDEAERMMIRLKELEMYIDGLSDLVEPNRKFLKFDMVTMSSGMGMKKDRCLFLFSDLLIITNLKRKNGTMRKPSTHSCSPQLYPTLETNKYKLLMRVSLEDLELARPVLIASKKPFNERELLECDLGVLSKISDLTTNLSASHQPLDDAVRNMMAQVSRQLSERQAHANDPSLSKVELTVATQNGLETVSVTFLSPNKRNTWERAFLEAKQALSLSADRRPPPDFLNPIPIRKTRAGLQLTCVATTTDLNVHDLKDVWVCNSDGYVGQVCVLSMQPEPALTSCVAVSNCKITCVASVPSATTIQHKGGALLHSGNISPISDHSSSDTNDPCIAMELNSDDSSDEDNSLDDHSRSCPSDKETFPMSLSEDEMAVKTQHVPDPSQGTMWIGMEDGRIFVYYCNDNIRIKKPRIKIQLPAAVHCITNTEHTVLVGLGNGQVAAFHRPAQGFWETLHPTFVDLGPSAAPVQRMILVCGRLWCACLNMIHVINLSTLKIEVSFPVVADTSRHVTDMVSSGLGVWVSVQNSVVLRLCNALTFDFIADLNLTPGVQKMLAGCDEILRQHKFACLRITAMLACKDLLWVGTSAGVIMTINIPHVVQGMTKLSSMPTVTGIWHGHTGQVRFLHCLEQNPIVNAPIPSTRRSIRRDHRRHSVAAATMNKMIVISGGDGYEDFRCTTQPVNGIVDNSGRDDSTNHLLLWQC